MGCFLACFGFSQKRRRRKPGNKVLPRDHRLGSYEPLDSSVEDPRISDSQLSDKIKERSSIRTGKKVIFNPNVQTHEPPKNKETTYQLWESDEDERREKNGGGLGKGSLSFISEVDSTVWKMRAFPSNHRYQNCRDSHKEDDDMAYIESDLDDEDEDEDENDEFEDDDDDETDVDGPRISQIEFSKQLNNQSVESSERTKINNHMQLRASTYDESNSIELKRNARDRSQYLNSVLNPVENLTQWKAVKAGTAVAKHPRKENIGLQQEAQVPVDSKTSSNLSLFSLAPNHHQSKPLLQEIAVDTSLSNWLASPNLKRVQNQKHQQQQQLFC